MVAKIIYKIYLNSCLTLSPNKFLAEKKLGETYLRLLSGDLMAERIPTIVNPANLRLEPGGGVCGKTYDEAGNEPFNECQEILKRQKRDSIQVDEAVLTSAGHLAPKIKTIIHAVGPIFDPTASQKNATSLTQAYTNSLDLLTAPQNHPDFISSKIEAKPMRSIAFPSISTGIYGYPLEQAAPIALEAVKNFIEKHPKALDEVRFVFFPLEKDKQKTAQYYQDTFSKLFG